MLQNIFWKTWSLKIKTKSGFVYLVGPPNVGKSTLINHLLGQKVSIVSRKVQTTRFSTKGILNIENSENNKPDCQIIFVDTPGIFEPKKALEKHIVKNRLKINLSWMMTKKVIDNNTNELNVLFINLIFIKYYQTFF